MQATTSDELELSIWRILEQQMLSVSHDRWHLTRVLAFAKQLQSVYGGDSDVIVAAALLHDLGRSDKQLHGQDSADKSVVDASRILTELGFPQRKVDGVLLAIREHDKPEVSPTSVEGKILKDADFLSGFGAWGILRTAMWTAESGGTVSRVVDRLSNGMLKRLHYLEFPESKEEGRLDYLFVSLFLSKLRKEARIDPLQRNGLYIVLEGISGSGKDSQAEILQSRLGLEGVSVLQVHEPTEQYSLLRNAWGSAKDDSAIQQFLLMADRYQLMRDRVKPALWSGECVISVRSFISTLVYQENDIYDLEELAFLHSFVPQPDIVILLDLEANVANERCKERAISKGKPLGSHENLIEFDKHRRGYMGILRMLKTIDIAVVDASGTIQDVSNKIWEIVKPRVPKSRTS